MIKAMPMLVSYYGIVEEFDNANCVAGWYFVHGRMNKKLILISLILPFCSE